jgi:hypothetical protein
MKVKGLSEISSWRNESNDYGQQIKTSILVPARGSSIGWRPRLMTPHEADVTSLNSSSLSCVDMLKKKKKKKKKTSILN